MTFVNDPYDRRQLLMMKRSIEDFKAGLIDLGRLVNNLESLFYLIKSPDPRWSKQFHTLWAAVDDAYAVLAHPEPTEWDAEARADISQSTDELLTLIENLLRSSENCAHSH